MSGIFINLGSVQRYGGRISSLSRAITPAVNVFAGAAAAFSTRIPAGSAYTGPLLRVQRSSDNAELDINALAVADANGNRWLNTTALLAFCGAGSGFVKTWYDQSGNGRHVTQASRSLQPRVVNAGVVDTLNGRPSPFGVGQHALVGPAPMATAAELTVSIVQRPASFIASGASGLTPWCLAGGPPRVQAHLPWVDGSVYFDLGGAGGSMRIMGPYGPVAGQAAIVTCVASVSRSLQQVYVNGILRAGDTSGGDATVLTVNIFGKVGFDESPRGPVAEFVFFPAALTPARQALERNQGEAFGITVE